MRHIAVIVSLMLLVGTAALAKEKSNKAQNRFTDGPQMIAKDIEYISAKSTNIFKVHYNLYIHPPLAQAMMQHAFSTEHKDAEKKLIDQSEKVCQQNSNADVCTVYYWTRLDTIPTLQEQTQEKLARAQGIYTKEREKKKATFQWVSTPPSEQNNLIQNEDSVENTSEHDFGDKNND